ncbi:MAG: 8-amino-7-oxononanoate synthase [Candidatus Omnitrophica bacterium]|nr:8-amino-7-oxononanoate synthase [Candidatus Omnitrophota bacterium]
MNQDWLTDHLEDLQQKNLRRHLRTCSSPQSSRTTIDGKEVINFCSNDYLGLANDPRLYSAASRAMAQYGFGAGASRLVCGNMAPHEELETALADLKKTQSALVFNSGYAANTGAISALFGRGDIIFADKFNHASIVDGIILSRAEFKRYPHGDMQALEEALKQSTGYKKRLIVTDSVFSMDGDAAPLNTIVALARRYDAWVMVDEAHAFGVLGENGGGLAEAMGLGADIDIQMGTLSKAAGCLGAYVCGGKELREYLINHARSFIYTTAMPPALAAAARCAVGIIGGPEGQQRREQLKSNAGYIRTGLKALGFDTMNSNTPIIPVLVKNAARAVAMSGRLLEQNIFVQAMRPPTVPVYAARLRVTVTATHTKEDLDCLLEGMKSL